MDMAQRLNIWTELENAESVESYDDNELNVAQWALFASSLGAVRIAEAVRSIVRDADIYEEEDFGVEWDWGEMKLSQSENGEIDQSDLNLTDPSKSSFGFNHEARLMNRVWSSAVSKLEQQNKTSRNSVIDDLILILKAQQSFYTTIHTLYNLNDHNVVEFTEMATKLIRETVGVLNLLRCCHSVKHIFAEHDLIAPDGQLSNVRWLQSSEKNEECCSFLSASFDPFVNRRLLGNAPIRKARFNPIIHVIDSISNLVSELEWSVCEVLLNANTLGRLTRMLSNNSLRGRGGAVPIPPKTEGEASPHVGINVLSRSLMLLNLYFDDKLLGQYDLVDVIGKFHTGLSYHAIELIGVVRARYQRVDTRKRSQVLMYQNGCHCLRIYTYSRCFNPAILVP